MSRYIDLHAHSTASDGTLTPTALLTHAHSKGMRVFALTDHDATSGIAEARIAAKQLGIHLVPGVEISVTWNKQTVHIVGLNIDENNEVLTEGLAGLRKFRDWRAREIADRLAKAGVPGAYDAAMELAQGQSVSRTHFAHFLVANGYAKNVKQVFKRYLVQGKPGHVAGDWAELGEAIGWIKNAGGQAVLAHPARYKLSLTKLKILINEFKALGGEGLEVVSGSHTRDEVHKMADLAAACSLFGSKGSDYHGPENVYMEMDRLPELPSNVVPVWHDWPQAGQASNS